MNDELKRMAWKVAGGVFLTDNHGLYDMEHDELIEHIKQHKWEIFESMSAEQIWEAMNRHAETIEEMFESAVNNPDIMQHYQ